MNNDNLESPASKHESSATAQLHRRRILLGALICALIANILCLPLWTDYDVGGLIRTPFNKEARMDIAYTGYLTGSEAFSITSSESSLCNSTNYRYAKDTQLYTANLQIGEEWKSYNLALYARKEGHIQIRLKGAYRSNDYGEVYSIPVDYRNLRIGDKEIFPDQKKVTYVKDFSWRVPVKTNDTVKISFDARRHHFDANDFNLRKTKNFWYIATLSILVFVISGGLLQHLTTSYKCGRLEDAIFLYVFFLLIAVPMISTSDAQRSLRENRTLTIRPKLSEVLVGNAGFGKRYDDWFCDHLGGREELIKLHDVIKGEIQQHIIQGSYTWQMLDNGWTFSLPFATEINRKHIQPIVTNLERLGKFCKENRIKLYVLVVPRKESVYQEYLYGYGMDKDKGLAENAFHEQIKYLVGRQHVTYIYPWKELRDASKQDYTFFKQTHHWTDWGAYIGYRALTREIRKEFPDIPVVSLKDYRQIQCKLIRDKWERDFYIPANSRLLEHFFVSKVDRCPSVPMYNYYDHKNGDRLAMKKGNFTKDYVYRGGGIQDYAAWHVSK